MTNYTGDELFEIGVACFKTAIDDKVDPEKAARVMLSVYEKNGYLVLPIDGDVHCLHCVVLSMAKAAVGRCGLPVEAVVRALTQALGVFLGLIDPPEIREQLLNQASLMLPTLVALGVLRREVNIGQEIHKTEPVDENGDALSKTSPTAGSA